MAQRVQKPVRPGGRKEPDVTRQALLNSAITLFEQFGFDATPVQRIVDDAGLTKGAFYHHFESKDDLLREIHDEFVDTQFAVLREVVARDLPADEALRQIVVEVLMEPLSVYKAEITVFLQERRFLSDETFADINQKREAFGDCIADVIAGGMDDGMFNRVGPPKLVAFGLIGMCSWAHTWLDPKGALSPREIGEMFADVLVDGLRA
jgi:AcrR family transcriptional regulator